ncbi:hypothetical protein Bca52824_063367 [Brassica carinata]|uniref:Uncharacterized protein n=1 Tax=Brassica carinata TaxID=52824 RepID=A0A8X7QGA1_BRACI|nr:hypothetical protein Bca52824_063367 [Brassica carinata]
MVSSYSDYFIKSDADSLKETNVSSSNDSLHLLLCEWLQVSSYASLSYASPLSPAMVVKPLGSEAEAEVMVIAALSHFNEIISYDDESSMTRNFLNVPSSQRSVGIDYSGLSLTSMDGYGLMSNLHNTAECSGHVDMEVTPQEKDVVVGKAHIRRWRKIFSVSR